MTEYVTAQIRTVLKSFQNTATKSLQGPGFSLVHSHKKEILSPEPGDEQQIIQPPPPELPQPVLSTADTDHGILYETILEGNPIACFLIGGEMRLCVPQILNTTLTRFHLDQIYQYLDDLQISCSVCTPEQLNEFKAASIIPENTTFTGLITRTNAERLCSALLHHSDTRRVMKGAVSFKVYHKCFGKCEGKCTPDLYSPKEPACIECLVCHGMFSPQKFVCHAHYNREKKTCHWGFDSSNWRAYLQVSKEEDSIEDCSKLLDELYDLDKQKTLNCFVVAAQRDGCNLKRKAVIQETHMPLPPCKSEPLDIPLKKPKRLDDTPNWIDYQYHQQALILQYRQQQQMSAFRPWTHPPPKHLSLPYPPNITYLNQEPPVLQNPERVVRLTECERFERTFQPNVALAPKRHSSPLPKERDKERGDIIMTTEVQIKQERPSTPTPPTTISNSPELRVSSPGVNDSAPFSPDALSGSNEITSSTSPVLSMPTKTNDHPMTKCERSPVPVENHHHHHHHLHQNSHHNHNSSNNNHHHNSHHQHPQPSLVIKNGTTAIVGNPEFELSTDTDDDSLAGEPDSSNTNVPLEMAADILKNARPEERDKILHIIKLLLHENIQLRHFSIENQNLLDEIRRKDEQIGDLLQHQQQFEQQHRRHLLTATAAAAKSNSSSTQQQIDRNNLGLADVVISPVEMASTTPPSPTTAPNHKTRNFELHKSPSSEYSTSRSEIKTEVIMKPLKKSSRRSPEESVLVTVTQMQSPPPPIPPTSSPMLITTIKREIQDNADISVINGDVTLHHNTSSSSFEPRIFNSNSSNDDKLISIKSSPDSG